MIDVMDLVQYLQTEGKIKKYKSVGSGDVMITCPHTHWKMDSHTGEMFGHLESHPSLGIMTTEPYMFNCFGCGFKGTVEYLVADVLGMNILDAVHWLSQRYDFDEDSYRKIDEKAIWKLADYEERFKAMIPMKEYEESYFLPFRQVHQYTIDRGFTMNTARKYEIGYDKWQRRIVMPIRNENEKIIGLYGRAIDQDNEVKYMYYNYDDEMAIHGWDKGRIVFFNRTDKHKDIVLVVESGLDVPWADQFGLTEEVDVASILGSKITKDQADQLAKYKEVIIGLDNDRAGEIGELMLIKYLGNRTKLSTVRYANGVKDLGECTEEQMLALIRNRKGVLNQSSERLKLRLD